jgi:membrane associated rhomboid family serine protease
LSLAAVWGLGFGVSWGLFIALLQQSYPVSCALWTAPLGGALFGVTMAAYYRWRVRKFALPRWEEYPAS